MRSVNFLISTFFGIGKLPGAPGTWASIAAAPLFWFLIDKPFWLFCAQSVSSSLVVMPFFIFLTDNLIWLFCVSLVIIYFVGVYCTSEYEKQIREKDPSSAVIDEVLGVGVAMFAIPHQWYYAVMAVILFRIFDIWKPYPIRRLEKLPAGWGIMTDDVLAGVYAWAWIQVGAFVVNTVLK